MVCTFKNNNTKNKDTPHFLGRRQCTWSRPAQQDTVIRRLKVTIGIGQEIFPPTDKSNSILFDSPLRVEFPSALCALI